MISQSQWHRSTASCHVTFTPVIHLFFLTISMKTQQAQKTLPSSEPSWCRCWMMLLWINECLNLIYFDFNSISRSLSHVKTLTFFYLYLCIKLSSWHLKDSQKTRVFNVVIPKFNQFKKYYWSKSNCYTKPSLRVWSGRNSCLM